MKEFLMVIKCNTPLELQMALLAMASEVSKRPDTYEHMRVDREKHCVFGTEFPHYELSRSE